MADIIISAVAEQVTGIIADKIRKEVSLVRGVKKELQSLSVELNTIRNALADAEKRRFKEDSVRDWLKRLEATSYEMDDVLDEWNFALLKHEMEQPSSKSKVRSFIQSSCLCFTKVTARHDTAKKIEILKAKLDQIMEEKDRYGFLITSQPLEYPSHAWRIQSTSLIKFEEIQGRDFERENLVSRLVAEGGTKQNLGTRVVSIVGAGGLGKTTLAKQAYNDSRVESAFELRIWICVSDPFNGFEIADEIITRAGGSKPDTNQLGAVVECLKRTISGRKFLLVLDDVWTENRNEWEDLHNSLNCGGAGSKF